MKKEMFVICLFLFSLSTFCREEKKKYFKVHDYLDPGIGYKLGKIKYLEKEKICNEIDDQLADAILKMNVRRRPRCSERRPFIGLSYKIKIEYPFYNPKKKEDLVFQKKCVLYRASHFSSVEKMRKWCQKSWRDGFENPYMVYLALLIKYKKDRIDFYKSKTTEKFPEDFQ